VINLDLNAAVAAGPPPVPTGETPVEGAFDAAMAFGDLLQDLMGSSSDAGAPDENPDVFDDGPRDRKAGDDLINPIVVDPQVPQALRLSLAATWIDAPAGAPGAAGLPSAEPAGVERAVRADAPAPNADAEVWLAAASAASPRMALAPVASAIDGGAFPAAVAALPAADAPPATGATRPMDPVAAEMLAAVAATTAAPVTPATPAIPAIPATPAIPVTGATIATGAPTPHAGVPLPAADMAAPEGGVNAAAPSLPGAAAKAVSPLPHAVVDPAVMAELTTGTSAPAPATPPATPPADALAGSPAAPSRGAETAGDKLDPPRVRQHAVEAGHRAYAAAAAETPAREFRGESGGARGEQPAPADPVVPPAAPPAAGAPAFAVVAERPTLTVGQAASPNVLAAPQHIDAAAAAELPAQVVQSIRLQAAGAGGEAIVRLRPDYLGELVVAVKVENGAVTAALQSDTPAVRRWVEANEATLRQGLAEHGLQLDRLTVTGDEPTTGTSERHDRRHDRSPEDEESPQPESRRRRQQDPDATFEVIV